MKLGDKIPLAMIESLVKKEGFSFKDYILTSKEGKKYALQQISKYLYEVRLIYGTKGSSKA